MTFLELHLFPKHLHNVHLVAQCTSEYSLWNFTYLLRTCSVLVGLLHFEVKKLHAASDVKSEKLILFFVIVYLKDVKETILKNLTCKLNMTTVMNFFKFG